LRLRPLFFVRYVEIARGCQLGTYRREAGAAQFLVQGRQLALLVDQVLLFASTQEGRSRYQLRPLTVSQILETVLSNTSALVERGGVTIEQQVAADLPQVMGDLPAVSEAADRLLTAVDTPDDPQLSLGEDLRALTQDETDTLVRFDLYWSHQAVCSPDDRRALAGALNIGNPDLELLPFDLCQIGAHKQRGGIETSGTHRCHCPHRT